MKRSGISAIIPVWVLIILIVAGCTEVDWRLDAMFYYCRGSYYLGTDQYEKAISDFTKAIEISPGNTGAYFNRGNAYGEKAHLTHCKRKEGQGYLRSPLVFRLTFANH